MTRDKRRYSFLILLSPRKGELKWIHIIRGSLERYTGFLQEKQREKKLCL
jgi:hypothetical protein